MPPSAELGAGLSEHSKRFVLVRKQLEQEVEFSATDAGLAVAQIVLSRVPGYLRRGLGHDVGQAIANENATYHAESLSPGIIQGSRFWQQKRNAT